MTTPTARVLLTNLTVDEGSLVDKGDNPEAHVVLTKSAPTGVLAKLKAWAAGVWKQEAGGGEDAPKTTSAILAEQEFVDQFADLKSAFMESVASILCSAPTTQTGVMLRVSVDEFAERAKALIDAAGMGATESAKRASRVFDTLLDAAIAEARGDVTKRAAFAGAVIALDGLRVFKEGGYMKTLAEVMAALSPEDRKVVEEALAAKAAPAAAQKMGDGKDPACKAAPETPPALSTEVQKQLDEVAKRAEKAEAEVTKLRDEKRTAEFVTKAQALNLTGQDVNTLAGVLRKAADAGIGAELDSLVAALSAQAKAGEALMQKVGIKGGADPGSPEGQILKMAEEVRKADPKLSPQQAYVKALEKNRELGAEVLTSAGR